MFRQWFLMGRMAVLAAASLLLVASAASAQQGYFKQLESQGWYGGRSNSSYRQSYFSPRFQSYSYYRQPYVSPRLEYDSNVVVDQRVRFHLQVPASARVWFDDEKTVQSGSSRDFITPPLPSGTQYSYAIRMEWTENGRKRESTRRVGFLAGDHVDLDLTKPVTAQAAVE